MAGNSRFHSKDHYHNHHTLSSVGFPDSATDPIASPAHPFKGDFILNGGLSANGGVSFLSANIGKDLYVQNIYNSNVITTNYISGYDSEAVFSDTNTIGHGNNTVTFKYSSGAYFDSDVNVTGTVLIGGSILIVGNVSAYGDLTYIDSNIVGTSALSVNNLGQGVGLTVNQSLGISPIARFENNGTIVLEISGNRATLNGILSTNNYIIAPNIAILQGVSAQYISLSTNFQNTYITVSSLSAGWQNTTSTVSANSANNSFSYSILTGGAAMGNLNAPAGYYVTTSLSSTMISANTLTAQNVNITNTLSANVLSANVFYGDGSKLTGIVAGGGGTTQNTVSSLSAGWQNTTSTVSANSANWGGINYSLLSGLSAVSFSFMFDGIGNPISNGATPAMAIIPTKCNITYWSLIADTTCTLAVSVLSTNYLNVGTTDFFLSSAFITTATKNASNASPTSIINYNFLQGDILKVAISANNNAKTLTMFLTGNKFGAQ